MSPLRSTLQSPPGGGMQSPDRRAIPALLFGLAAGPAGWIAQLLLDYGLSSYACYPADRPFVQAPPPGWAGDKPILAVIAAVCLAFVLCGLWVSVISWRRTRAHPPRGVDQAVEGRSCFLALCGMLLSTGFAAAIVASAVSIFVVPSCWIFVR